MYIAHLWALTARLLSFNKHITDIDPVRCILRWHWIIFTTSWLTTPSAHTYWLVMHVRSLIGGIWDRLAIRLCVDRTILFLGLEDRIFGDYDDTIVSLWSAALRPPALLVQYVNRAPSCIEPELRYLTIKRPPYCLLSQWIDHSIVFFGWVVLLTFNGVSFALFQRSNERLVLLRLTEQDWG